MPAASTRSPFDRLRRISAQEARRRTAWARAVGAELDVELPYGMRASARGLPGLFAPGAFDRFFGPGVTGLFIVNELEPSVRMLAFVDARAIRAVLSHVLDAPAEEPSSAPLDELEAGAAHFTAAKIVRTASREKLRLGAVLTERAAIRAALGQEVWDHLGVDLAYDGVTYRLDLLRRGALETDRIPSARERAGKVALPLSLSAGFASLSLAELSTLAVGDALLLDRAADEGAAFLFVPGTIHARRASFARRRVIVGPEVDLPALNQGVFMENRDVTRPLDHARVEVSAELARTSMRVAEIERLAEGEIFELGVDVGDSVALRAGDVIIARGELVDVDGRLGVLIRALGA